MNNINGVQMKKMLALGLISIFLSFQASAAETATYRCNGGTVTFELSTTSGFSATIEGGDQRGYYTFQLPSGKGLNTIVQNQEFTIANLKWYTDAEAALLGDGPGEKINTLSMKNCTMISN